MIFFFKLSTESLWILETLAHKHTIDQLMVVISLIVVFISFFIESITSTDGVQSQLRQCEQKKDIVTWISLTV